MKIKTLFVPLKNVTRIKHTHTESVHNGQLHRMNVYQAWQNAGMREKVYAKTDLDTVYSEAEDFFMKIEKRLVTISKWRFVDCSKHTPHVTGNGYLHIPYTSISITFDTSELSMVLTWYTTTMIAWHVGMYSWSLAKELCLVDESKSRKHVFNKGVPLLPLLGSRAPRG